MNIDKIMESIKRWMPQHVYGAICVLILGLAFGFVLGFGGLIFLETKFQWRIFPFFEKKLKGL